MSDKKLAETLKKIDDDFEAAVRENERRPWWRRRRLTRQQFAEWWISTNHIRSWEAEYVLYYAITTA